MRGMATARTRIHRRQLAGVMLAAAAITPFFNLLTSRASVAEAVQGLVDAVLVSSSPAAISSSSGTDAPARGSGASASAPISRSPA